MKEIKVNVLATSSFHVLDLARELKKQGMDVKFYSYLPHYITKREGFGYKSSVSLFLIAAPFLLIEKLFPKHRVSIQYYRNLILDYLFSLLQRKADVCIALGSVYYKVFENASKRGTVTILEWGSKHIIEQRKCFGIPDSFHPEVLKRELDSYEIVDYIAIPSSQVADTFSLHGVSSSKLLINPYGVDCTQFPPTELDKEETFDLISVGGWRYEKGSDILVDLCKNSNYSLLHVGSIVNMVFPKLPNMKHIDAVPPAELTNYYKKARVFVIPSRAEGLALVQAQAISSGLPIVCSKETGGRDLRDIIDDKRWIIEMNDLSVDELKRCVDDALRLSQTQSGVRKYTQIEPLSWEKYGERYYNSILKIIKS